MLIRDRQLLCTFINTSDYTDVCDHVLEFYDVIDNQIFVFSNIKVVNEYYITYNVNCGSDNIGKFPNTISIHRKKHFNTLYTLNAMNKLIADENNGVFDKSFQLDWSLYKNSLILTNDVGVTIVSLKLVDIIS